MFAKDREAMRLTPAEVKLILDQIDLRVAADRQNGVEPSSPKPTKSRGYSR